MASGTSLSIKILVSSPLVSCSSALAASAAVCTSQNSGTYKSKPKQFRRPQKMKEEQYSSEPPIWMQNMMEWMMQSCQQPPTGRQAWVEKNSYPMRGYRRT
jgi:hypothetical protein